MKRSKAKPSWMQRHVADPYVRRARAEGYRSRAAYKLLQIAAREHLFRPGMIVLDLGAAPGGWSQVAAQAVAPAGRVIAVDRLEMAPLAGVDFVRGDFLDAATRDELGRLLEGARADLVLCDLSPNVSGIASTDQAQAVALAELARDVALNYLKPQGIFLVKAFQGRDFEAYLRSLRERFERVAMRKPVASRSESPEVYLVARGCRSGRAASCSD